MKAKGEFVSESAQRALSKRAEARIPRLRFLEFKNAGEWRKKEIMAICEINPSVGSLPKEFVYIDLESVSSGNLLEKKITRLEDAPSRAQRLLQNGDVVFQMVRPYQRNNLICRFNDANCYVASTGYAQLRPHGSSEFLYQVIHTDLFVEKVLIKCTGSSYPAISSTDLGAINIPIPNLAEQQKIAACLSFLDELVAAHSKKLDALKKHKHGLMQQLFPAEGEIMPRLRFPEFEEAGEWEDKKASGLFINRIAKGEAGLPIYSVTMNDGMIKRSLLERDFDDIAEPEGNKKACKDDIAYNMMQMWQGALGVAAEDCMVSPAYVVLEPIDSVCSEFYACLFKFPKYLRLLASHSQRLTSDRFRLYYRDFAHILLPHPSQPEQQKIASCLSSLDDLIAAQAAQVEKLQLYKKALMQGLFPKADEDGA